MRCTICQVDTDVGEDYEFHYGTKLHTTYWAAGIRYGSTTLYKIVGAENGFYCLECMRQHVLKEMRRAQLIATPLLGLVPLMLVILLLAAPFSETARDALGPLSAMLVIILAFGAVLYLWFLLRVEKVRNGDKSRVMREMQLLTPDSLAIKLRKAHLIREGYDAFFTRAQYRGLVDQNTRLWH